MPISEDEVERLIQLAGTSKGAGLISIREAARRGFNKIRLDKWTNPDDYMEFDIISGEPGPWFRLWSPANEIIDAPNPQKLLCTMMGDMDDPCWRPLPRTLIRNSNES